MKHLFCFKILFCLSWKTNKQTNKKSQIGNESKQQDLVAAELNRNTSEPHSNPDHTCELERLIAFSIISSTICDEPQVGAN